MNRLSEAERETGRVLNGVRWYGEAAVEAIIESRLASVEASFAGIRCALLHWQAEGVTKAVSCPNCQSWAATIAMPFFVLGSDAHTEQKGAGA